MPFHSGLSRFLEPPVVESPDKSYVTLEQQICKVCGRPFDTGALLLDEYLRNRFDMHTVTGWGMCPDDQKKYDDGFIALIETRNSPAGSTMQPSDADRTGVVIHVRETAFTQLFKTPSRDDKGVMLPMAFIDNEVVKKLQEIYDRCEASASCEAEQQKDAPEAQS